MKTSAMPENIAGEIPYLSNLFELLKTNKTDGLIVLNQIINGLGEILGLGQVFDFQLYEILEMLLSEAPTSESAVVLLNAKEKFETLTENDEYLFDETKEVKQEIFEIKKLLSKVKASQIIEEEISENSPFVFTAIDLTTSTDKIRNLLFNATNQTLVLKAIEALKERNNLTQNDKISALKLVTDSNIKNIINAI
ncbi:unknown [Clostridium sp. CAG:813]|nr:unknown [Clostridium sp. CAG:813]